MMVLLGFVLGVAYVFAGLWLLLKSSEALTRKLQILAGKGAVGAFSFLLMWPTMVILALLCSEQTLQTYKQ